MGVLLSASPIGTLLQMEKVQFEWDERKDRENQRKHGVSFARAQDAFADPRRVIAEDVAHNQAERRYYAWARFMTES